ncbi:MAG: hypothetical protein K0Q95_2455 [Bacteroidota bacterium]|jgi:hypothetical protein|nr:hypothetical protein [Bacteroidota bacterium]
MNRPNVSPDEINQRKNFDSVLKNTPAAGSKPLFKKPWFLSGVVVTAAVVIATVVILNKKEDVNKNPIVQQEFNADSLALLEFYKAEAAKPCIAPPLKGINVPYTVYKVDAEKGASLDFKTGSKLNIPKNAFVDQSGKPVKGEVELRYREFHDVADFFVSGIPMTYDSAGVRYQFESAGMMEMLAYKDGEPVNMAPQKTINVELASEYKGTEYNLYKLDTLKNNWACLGKDKVVANPLVKATAIPEVIKQVQQVPEYKELEIKKEEAAEEKEVKIAALPKPLPEPKKPAKLNRDKFTFNLDLDLNEFPEFTVYKNVQWELGPENKNMNNALFADLNKTVWEDAVLKEGNKKGENYYLSLKKGSRKVNDLVVYPVFEGNNYEAALKKFQEKFEKYSTVLEKRKEEEIKIEAKYQADLEKYNKAQADLVARMEREQKLMMARMSTEEKVMRVFAISSFGVFNCDNPSVYPKGIKCSPAFVNENDVKLKCYNIYLADRNRNGLFTYYKNPLNTFSFDPRSTNILWTVEDGKLYYLKPEDFNAIQNTTGIIHLKQQQFASVDELKKFFNL